MKYNPHEYQDYATNFIVEHPVSAVLLEMGLGKSVITLTAIMELMYERFEVGKVLVIGPLRVARDTWPAEIKKWDHLKELSYSVVIGTEEERKAALRKKASIYLINRENIDWLITKSGYSFDFDMVVIDELSSFKSAQEKRFKSLLKVRPKVKRIVGLTGTPSSNGLMDLWAEFRLLDMGERLGRFITHLAMAKRNDRKLGLAKEIGDFDEYFDSSMSDSGAIMNQATGGGFDIVFECVGTKESLAASIDAVKAGGKIITVGNSIDDTIQISLNKIVLHEINLIGSVSCTRTEFEETIDLIASGMIDVDKYVTDIMKLDELQQAFERLTSKTDPVVKIVVKP